MDKIIIKKIELIDETKNSLGFLNVQKLKLLINPNKLYIVEFWIDSKGRYFNECVEMLGKDLNNEQILSLIIDNIDEID